MRINAGDERLIVHHDAEVGCLSVGDRLAWIVDPAQIFADEFIETNPFRTGQLETTAPPLAERAYVRKVRTLLGSLLGGRDLQMMPVASADEIKSGKPGEVDLWCYFPASNPDPDMFAA